MKVPKATRAQYIVTSRAPAKWHARVPGAHLGHLIEPPFNSNQKANPPLLSFLFPWALRGQTHSSIIGSQFRGSTSFLSIHMPFCGRAPLSLWAWIQTDVWFVLFGFSTCPVDMFQSRWSNWACITSMARIIQ